ncbi:hypothetical protein A3D05_04035 [Candidatus Gottesmanbacteria bacterium RIFCSPHIGHO2_02_FULL_40_24]|uniref:Uncharacterized protein n=1 Tax=Candidatus Gottesmanbacteria bacterium RIFCSPHIGHO2_01_FULL_40_15 TaxID=1798376 RepID=A0A1F5Z144_9BACT|nr:MAG: hypothetical protein A2777_00825 [Candidatus Gottesmanbacteria bacterium RIFCSPHIGHO2_01_FULL_40_15]OGG17476.1 MAG: hypothetical protein A3D05_04035 [Candidatus Gottesmanbacteria bacterium RIFCSPHIGHO2_02_FULL_40_24]OGG21519.1 MAG: hypothetical protein A3B48_01875 [Candidatus Gottesmanbacteria bacterium RIFCSPLOWO2_01_FULL_40_10]OGG32760.1 MAG: hypothetical protein A3I80_00370 [Candidatus Gottesmanbacteria bacterium RIFCSPLOWO2_02_FULL_40_10]
MKIIVTHFAPDVDAITSVWLLKRFLPEWKEAEVRFVPAGKSFENQIVDSDPDILHVDTGMGQLDHHQTDEDTCAAKLTLDFIFKNKSAVNKKKKGTAGNDAPMERLVEVVNDIDHFREVYFPNPMSDYYDFGLVAIFDGWKLIFSDEPLKIVELGLLTLDGIYKNFQNKVWAENEIDKKGIEFKTKWGKGIALETVNDEVIRIAQRTGFTVAVRKDPKKDYVRIKSLPQSEADLTACYNIFRKLDKEATWFLHSSRKMILNGSIKNPESKPTKLTLREIVNVLKNE